MQAAGNSQDSIEGCKDNGRDGHFVVAPRMVLAASVTSAALLTVAVGRTAMAWM
jgi:hypothetical protein